MCDVWRASLESRWGGKERKAAPTGELLKTGNRADEVIRLKASQCVSVGQNTRT